MSNPDPEFQFDRGDVLVVVGTEDAHEGLEATYPEALAPIPIPQSQDIKNAQREGRTIFALEDPSPTARRAREAYRENAMRFSTGSNGRK